MTHLHSPLKINQMDRYIYIYTNPMDPIMKKHLRPHARMARKIATLVQARRARLVPHILQVTPIEKSSAEGKSHDQHLPDIFLLIACPSQEHFWKITSLFMG